MNTTDNNKLIAEFMGIELEETLHGLMVYAIVINRNNPLKENDIETDFFEPQELKYHTSWDWLIPVVQKLNEDVESSFIKTEYMSEISSHILVNERLFAHQRVVEFINWYNKNI